MRLPVLTATAPQRRQQDAAAQAAKMEEAARLLAAGRTRTEAAKALGVNRTTLWRWERRDAFQAAYAAAIAETTDAIGPSWLDAQRAALAALARMLEPDAPPLLQLAAARIVLGRMTAPAPPQPAPWRTPEEVADARRQWEEYRAAFARWRKTPPGREWEAACDRGEVACGPRPYGMPREPACPDPGTEAE